MPLYIKMPENINETTRHLKLRIQKNHRHVAFCCFIVINII